MSKTYLKLAAALCFSLACYSGVSFWYNFTKDRSQSDQDKEPIAKLDDHVNEIQRKPITRVIWEAISKDDLLFPGETIRSSHNSEATIEFLKGGFSIELEPDSMITLEENLEGISLNFLKGNVFIKKKAGAPSTSTQKITVKSGESKIDLNNAQIALSKSQKGKVDLQVLSGEAVVKKGDESVTFDKNKSGELSATELKVIDEKINVISPVTEMPIYLTKDYKQVEFRWQKLPPGYQVQVETGPRRSELKLLEEHVVNGEVGSLKVPAKVGKMYWRLKATATDPNLKTQVSQIYRNPVLLKAAAQLLKPKNDEVIVIKDNETEVKFDWVYVARPMQAVVEIAQDPEFKNIIKSHKISSFDSTVKFPLSENPNYFWRVKQTIKSSDPNKAREVLVSEAQSFSVTKNISLVPPKLKSPMKNQELSSEDVSKRGVFFSWQPVPGVESYKIEVKKVGGEAKLHESMSTPFRLETLEPGEYTWRVTSVDMYENQSPPSEANNFTVLDLPFIQWAEGEGDSEYEYFTAKPSLYAKWQNDIANVKYWLVRFAPEGELTSDSKWRKSTRPYLNTYVPNDGRYDIEVVGVNEDGKTVAKSRQKTYQVSAIPLLPGPTYADSLPQVLKSNLRGKVDISWQPVDGANQYHLKVYNNSGQLLKQQKVDRTIASVNKLKPGNYKISIQSIDKYKRTGPKSEVRELVVPNKSDIKAPTFNKFNVK